jgi:DNA-binding transcriptional regulator YhcF (GntR family)
MLEDILMKKKNTDNSEVTKKQDRDVQKKQKEISKILKKNIDSLLRQMEKQGMSKKDLIKILTGE